MKKPDRIERQKGKKNKSSLSQEVEVEDDTGKGFKKK